MNAQLVNPFLSALSTILPQLGFKKVVRGKLFPKDQFIDTRGVVINVQFHNQVTGNIAFTMTEDSAKRLSETMMMGMPVQQFDGVAQSALCEMVNIVTSNAATALKKAGLDVNVIPPALSQSNSPLKISNSNFIVIEMIIDELPVEVGIALN